jgi:PAS domain-containing protein
MLAKPLNGSVNQPPELSSLCFFMTDRAPMPMAALEGANHTVRYANPAFCRLVDKTKEQMVGRPFAEILPEKDECLTLLDRVFRAGEAASQTEQNHSPAHPGFWSYTIGRSWWKGPFSGSSFNGPRPSC